MSEYWSDNSGGTPPQPQRLLVPKSSGVEEWEVEIIHLDYWQIVACTLGGFVLGATVMFKILGGIPL